MGLLRSLYRVTFKGFERLGVHVTPTHYAFPIPDTTELTPAAWERPLTIPGLDLREAEQLELLFRIGADYGPEFAALATRNGHGGPHAFRFGNRHFETVDAEILYGLMRLRKPKRFIEAGSGFSTLLALEAAAANAKEGSPCRIEVYDPRPRPLVRARASEIDLQAMPIQKAPLETFTSLEAGDILFVDSTHILQVGSDVRFLLADVIPRLAPGVMVQVHDVFLPDDYPRYWVVDRLRFWNEQYAIQAFLCFNDRFQVLWGSSLMARRHPRELMDAFPTFKPDDIPASFWFERVG